MLEMKEVFPLALLALLGAYRDSAGELSLKLTSEDLLEKRLRAGMVNPKDREGAVLALFSEAGCTGALQAVHKNVDNVICTLPSETQSTIIVGGHYDFRTEGQGIVDDWSGTALLASLYETLKGQPHKHTYKFVAFAAEEAGLVGSGHFTKRMTAEEKSARS
jgi:Peptidase family M28